MKLNAVFVQPKLTATFKPASLQPTTGIPVARDYLETPAYEGETVVTPSSVTQTLATEGLRLTQNITINPIPSNYGRIAWNGSIITVS